VNNGCINDERMNEYLDTNEDAQYLRHVLLQKNEVVCIFGIVCENAQDQLERYL